MTAQDFAYHEYKDYVIYKALLKGEKNPQFRNILESLIDHEKKHFEFWRELSDKKEFKISPITIFFIKLMRRVFGLTFTAKFIEREEREAIENYSIFMQDAAPELKEKVIAIMEHEKEHEYAMINQIEEGKVTFISNIILGLNDGLIELTGALVGFSFALVNTQLVALTGFITGVAASLSMASSAYLQARHQKNEDTQRNAKKAAIYTGIAYFTVVLILISPFLLTTHTWIALTSVGVLVIGIIAIASYYTSIIFDRKFKGQFWEIFIFGAGVALISFLIGTLLRHFLGIEV